MFCLTLLSNQLSRPATRLDESVGEMPGCCWSQLPLQQSREPPGNMAAIPVRARWLWFTPARSFLDRDMCSAPLVVLLYFLAPYCLETGRDEQNTNFSMMWADLLSATTSRSELYLRRATPVGAPAAASNLQGGGEKTHFLRCS